MKRQSRSKFRPCARGRTKKRIVLGVTGSFGTGKTAVARIFKSLGARIIDADSIAHQVIRPHTLIYKRIINTFGKGILKKNKTIDRDKLARIVFNKRSLLKRLNRIVHPEVIRIIKHKIKTSPAKVIILDAPLLIEAGLKKAVDRLIVVKATRKKQIERILKKGSLKQKAILKRIGQQISLGKKVRLADFVIDNSGTLTATRKQVKKIWERIIAH